ncbi:hypothetical protein WDR10_01040 [Kurthia gibsonii]|uniref:hypothetical protein n=1 Tax=Kurthia gibsonii TaxID=33946 RepID=UPI0030CFECDA
MDFREILAKYLTMFAQVGFLLSFACNVFIGVQGIPSTIVISELTSIACFLFIFLYVITKFIIKPKTKNDVFDSIH